MGPNKEGIGSLGDLSMKQLRDYWEKADNTPGEQVMVKGFGSVTKGEVYEELVGRSERKNTRSTKLGSGLPLRRTFHPIDGSWEMRKQNKIGALMARSRR